MRARRRNASLERVWVAENGTTIYDEDKARGFLVGPCTAAGDDAEKTPPQPLHRRRRPSRFCGRGLHALPLAVVVIPPKKNGTALCRRLCLQAVPIPPLPPATPPPTRPRHETHPRRGRARRRHARQALKTTPAHGRRPRRRRWRQPFFLGVERQWCRGRSAARAQPPGWQGGRAPPIFVESYDGMRKQRVAWDAERRRFQVMTHPTHGDSLEARIKRYLCQSFLPDHVTPDYYNYTKWRVLQRLISATVSVFGTRALLLALGLKTERVGLAATFNWIQKDAFGKFGRIMWASKMGRRFDSDAKRWRFRSSLLYAAGTGLEVLTYIFPAAFLLLATIANILKQMSMLTSSATRNAMYKSFAGDSQNLGDITAKGEAQIAVVDLLGILLGIFLSKSIGTAQIGMGVAYILLSCVDVFAIYNEIRSVVFSSLNLERGAMVVKGFVAQGAEGIPTPNAASRQEYIFWNPASIDTSIFRTVSQTGCSLDELHKVREAFPATEHFLVTWSPSVGTSIVLNTSANHNDILRALLTWAYFNQAWEEGQGAAQMQKQRHAWSAEEQEVEDRRQERALAALKTAHDQARSAEAGFLQALAAKGWDMRHTVFGKIKKRTDW